VAFLQFLGMVAVIDTWQYWGHRFMHVNRWFYVHVHSWHHKIHAPYAMSASFNHPVEGFLLDTLSGAIVSGTSFTLTPESLTHCALCLRRACSSSGPHPDAAAAAFVTALASE